MVLAAGRGERMRPLSDAVPKPALPLPEGPVVGWPLRLARRAGAQRIVVNTWHRAQRMQRILHEIHAPGAEVAVCREEHLMGTAGGLALARDRGLLGDDGPVLVLNGDGVLSLDLSALLLRHQQSADRVSLGLLPHLDLSRWSRVLLDNDGLVTAMRPPGPSPTGEVPLLYSGVMVVSRSALDDLPVEPGGVGERLWSPIMAEGRLGGVLVAGHWREVGTPADYLAAALSQIRDRRAVHATAVVSTSARLEQVFAGRDARIEGGAVLAESVVAEGAAVRSGARVIRSVLLGPVEVTPGERVADEFRAAPPEE
jgi:NDP-sugar pyrophosphorylase family protein